MSQGKASVALVGNIVRDPEVRHTGAGMAVANFTIAVTEKRKDREDTAYIDCKVFDKRGEAFARYHKKGSRAIVFGRLQQENWEDKQTGAKRSKLSVIVDDWLFAGGREEQSAPSHSPQSTCSAGTVGMSESDDTPV